MLLASLEVKARPLVAVVELSGPSVWFVVSTAAMVKELTVIGAIEAVGADWVWLCPDPPVLPELPEVPEPLELLELPELPWNA